MNVNIDKDCFENISLSKRANIKVLGTLKSLLIQSNSTNMKNTVAKDKILVSPLKYNQTVSTIA
jgi:hypothetical protein